MKNVSEEKKTKKSARGTKGRGRIDGTALGEGNDRQQNAAEMKHTGFAIIGTERGDGDIIFKVLLI
jgi:hypothetical protein